MQDGVIDKSLRPQQVVLTVTENKVQLIDLICAECENESCRAGLKHKLVVTRRDPVPVEITKETTSERNDAQ